MAQLGRSNHLCAWSCAIFGSDDIHEQYCKHPIEKTPQIQHVRPQGKYAFAAFGDLNGSGAHAILQ